MKKLIVFDLDGTLAPSKSSLAPETAALLHDLLGIIKGPYGGAKKEDHRLSEQGC
jgi:FMN phosphatase YigB (HAD superfamily)